VTAKWFPVSQYKEAHEHAVEVARSLDGRFEVGIEKMSEYGKPGYRSGFLLPKPKNRYGFELRCEVVRASDGISKISKN
jgi:hypothetical protein